MNADSGGMYVVTRRRGVELEIAGMLAGAPDPGWTSLKIEMNCVGNVQRPVFQMYCRTVLMPSRLCLL